MIDFAANTTNSMLALGVLVVGLIVIFSLTERWATVGGLGVAYLGAFLLGRGVAPVASVFVMLATGFFVLIILGMSLQQVQQLFTMREPHSGQALALPLRLVTVLVALALTWVAAQFAQPLPPLADYLVWPIFALCGLGLWLAVVGGAWFRSGVGLLLFLTGLLLLAGSAQSNPIWLGAIATLQLLVALSIGGVLLRQGASERLLSMEVSAE